MKACLFFAAFLTLSPAVAAEKGTCAPWLELKQDLAAKYHEIQIAGGLINEKTLIAVFASAGGATWTTIAVDSDGNACVLTVGTDWFQNGPPAPPPGGRQS
ncbi:MAG: hypothetical protein E5W82_10355 [Mesorhizobium sp.]|nr:MAG: hypothetical protein E5W82_10355 [Mesorhizobium sp.]